MEELKKNVAWVRREEPVIHADGVFAETITMNPCVFVENDTLYLFYAGDDSTGRRQVRLATAPVSDPEHFSFRGIMISNDETPGSFCYQWCVLPHVVKLPDGTYYMLFSGNCGRGEGLNAFPGLGCAFSRDLLHWEKYPHNPVISPGHLPDLDLVGIAGGGLMCEPAGDGYVLRLYFTGCPTLGDNIFMDQQKACCYAESTDGIHWTQFGTVHRRITSLDYENIASTGGPVMRDDDGLIRHWYSAIGTRWGVYSIAYAESEDGLHFNKGTRYGDSLSAGPKVRDIGELLFKPWKERWEDQSVSYPSVTRMPDGSLRLYYCGNDYGCGGIGTAVSAPFRIALCGKAGGAFRLWEHEKGKLYTGKLTAEVRVEGFEQLTAGQYEEGITYNTSVFYEEVYRDASGMPIFSIRVAAVNEADGVRIDYMAENRTAEPVRGIRIVIEGTGSGNPDIAFRDAEVTHADGKCVLHMPEIAGWASACVHGKIVPER